MSADAGIRPGLKILGAPDAISCEGDVCLVPDAPALGAEGSHVAKKTAV